MYTRTQVAAGKYAVKAKNPDEAHVIVGMFDDWIASKERMVRNWHDNEEDTCYCPYDRSHSHICGYEADGYTIITISDIESGEGSVTAEQQLFNYLHNELGVTALHSNLSDIISIINPTKYPYVLNDTPTAPIEDVRVDWEEAMTEAHKASNDFADAQGLDFNKHADIAKFYQAKFDYLKTNYKLTKI